VPWLAVSVKAAVGHQRQSQTDVDTHSYFVERTTAVTHSITGAVGLGVELRPIQRLGFTLGLMAVGGVPVASSALSYSSLWGGNGSTHAQTGGGQRTGDLRLTTGLLASF
jgi:hypothetical protein